MAVHDLGDGDALHVEHRHPAGSAGRTFVFFNALTGDVSAWEASIAPALRAEGHGSLCWNFRGQKDSPFGSSRPITGASIVEDAVALLRAEAPVRPLFVGLSIGGLFAAQTHLEGVPCQGILLINTLRKPGTRLTWVNRAVHRAALTGGPRLIQDLFMPLLSGPAWQDQHHAQFLQDEAYQGLDPASGTARLLKAGIGTDWDFPWARLTMPVTVLTGLQDRVFYDAAEVAELTQRLPDATTLELAEVGHLVTMERPAAITDACLDLARRIPA